SALFFAFCGALTLSSFHSAAPIWETWRLWFLAHGAGILIVAPVLIELGHLRRELPPKGEIMEGTAFLALLAFFSIFVFTRAPGSWVPLIPVMAFLPLMLWPAARCRPVFAFAGMFVFSTVLVCTTIFGTGRFGDVRLPITDRVFTTETALWVVTITIIIQAAL